VALVIAAALVVTGLLTWTAAAAVLAFVTGRAIRLGDEYTSLDLVRRDDAHHLVDWN
jgi:uncharacterized membrane protein YphA (DoxX/SURF4 family)